ncbi:amidase signature enzyme [Xylariaceae sp. FL0016]|nr:amidase signature enzyme [Xylariaceae sp. FL0016]
MSRGDPTYKTTRSSSTSIVQPFIHSINTISSVSVTTPHSPSFPVFPRLPINMKLVKSGHSSPRSHLSRVVRALAGTCLYLTSSADATAAGYDALESTISGMHSALATNTTTCRSVVQQHLARIEEFNPTVNAMTSLNPDALSIADELDAQLAAGNMTGKLFCVPVVLKDNYDAVGMNTTGANTDLAGNHPTADAPTVKALRDEGAVIIGKANLHEMALEGLSVSSLGGQTLNPYDHTRTPGGSSGGTGAALATSFSILGTGTDTVNSLRSPASANNLVSVRPTRGLLSRTGVMPISTTQDNVGPMARTIEDLAVALTVMASVGADERDNSTLAVPVEARGIDYSAALQLTGGDLSGLRIGALDGFWNHTPSPETTPVIDTMTSMVEFLTSQGAEVVTITDPIYNATALAGLDVQTFEFNDTLNAYLNSPTLEGDRPTSLTELYSSGKFLVIPSQYGFMNKTRVSSKSDPAYATALDGITNLTASLQATFDSNKLDAVIYPEQKNLVVKTGSPSQAGRNGILGALTGFPVVTVPAGFSPASDDAPAGVPIGMEIMGKPFTESKLLNLGNQITQMRPLRQPPTFANRTVASNGLVGMPSMVPNITNIPATYPIGKLS